ncbi:MAG TPA: hypothetical protein VGJ26_18630 [Pirellulales bacterium]|jgi:hypothetical protein
MSAPKKEKDAAKPKEAKSAKSGGGSELQKLLRAPVRFLLIAAVICAAVGGGGYALWKAVGSQVLHRDHYRLSVESLDVTPPPPWLHADIRKDVFYQAGLDEVGWIHDADLPQRVAKAFEGYPWVQKVTRVTKRAPARIEVELVYRRPVCMVEVTGGAFPVDAEGIVLPKDDIAPTDARRLPRLSGVRTFPAGFVGMPWGDLGVVGGAEIAAALLDQWETLRLDRIVVVAASTPGVLFELLPQAVEGHPTARIIWGHAPGSHEKNEAPVADKIARLMRFLTDKSQNGSSSGALQIDLRFGPIEHTAQETSGATETK